MANGLDITDIGIIAQAAEVAMAPHLELRQKDPHNVCTWSNSEAIAENLIPAGDGKYDNETTNGRQEVLAIARRRIDTYTAERAEAQTLLDSVHAGTTDLGSCAVARWSTRQELALKAVAEFDHLRAEGRSLSVEEVDAR